MSELPTGWVETHLGTAVRARMGKTILSPELKTDGLPVFSASVGSEPWGFTDQRDVVFRRGTIVVSARGTIGDVKLPDFDEFVSTQTTIAITTPDDVDPKFVMHQLRCVDWPQFTATTAIPMLTIGKLNEIRLRLAPLPEQRRIVAKVDALTARTARARADLSRMPTLIARYKQRLLALAFSGELTAGWRSANDVPPDTQALAGLTSELEGLAFSTTWTSGTLSELAENHDGKRRPIKAADRAPRHGEYRYYGASGVIDTIDDYLFDGDYLLIGEDGANLISRSTPIAFLASGQFWVNNHAHILKAKPLTSNQYLCWFINMISLVPYVTGSAQPKLTQANLNKIRAPLPPLPEQAEIVRRIESAFGWLDRIAADHAAAARLIPKLDAAILTKAFRGDLVPQDPADEPASVLLERIKADREAAPSRGAKRTARAAELAN